MTEADISAGGARQKASKADKEDALTKRQRRKQTNEKQAWPQHPKVQSPAARARAYLRTAGLNNSNKNAALLDPAIDLHSPQVKFGRLLGATDQRVRHQAVLQLSAYLKARCDINNETGGLSELDLLKLWKGLWYTLYMADKVPVQADLSGKIAGLIWCVAGSEEEDEFAGKAYLDMYGDDDELGYEEDDEDVQMEEIANTMEDDSGDDEESEDESRSDDSEPHDHDYEDSAGSDDSQDEDVEELDDSEIPHCRGAHLASLFVRTFFRTVRRDWDKMDKYRVDKFYTIMRLMMHEVYKYMAVRHWNVGIIRLFNDAIFEEILSQTPNGLRYHLIDIALDELAQVHAHSTMPLTEATFLDCLEPFFALAQTGAGDDIVQHRAVENVLEKFLLKYSVVSQRVVEDAEDESEDEVAVFDQVHVGTIAKFIFDIASDGATGNEYRKSLYELHKRYARRLKQVGHDVDIGSGVDQEADDDQEDEELDVEVPQIEVEEEAEDQGEVEEKSNKNKRKKDKKRKKKEETIKKEEEQAAVAPKKDGKKKNKRKSSAPTEDDVGRGEEEVTISLTDQQKAKEAMKPKKSVEIKVPASEQKSKKKRKTSNGDDTPPGRRGVSFGDRNQFRSWKVSMNGLRSMELSGTPNGTPEKGILLKKTPIVKARSATKKKGKRAKATGRQSY